MESKSGKKPSEVCVTVDPGICGLPCVIRVCRNETRAVALEISECECKHIQQLSAQLKTITLKELFMPLDRNPVYNAAQRAGCHAACPVPMAVVKAVEVALQVALPREVRIEFKS